MTLVREGSGRLSDASASRVTHRGQPQEQQVERKAGIVLGSGYKVKIGKNRGVMPDLQFFKRGRKVPDKALGSYQNSAQRLLKRGYQ